MLIFEEDTQRSGKLIKGYKSNWNWKKKDGSYAKGENFLSVHWEVHDHSPHIVRLHVESPKQEKDLTLNALKNRIIVSLLSNIFKIKETITFGGLKIGVQLQLSHVNKSTEVFHIELHNGQDDSSKEHVERINPIIECYIDEALKYHLKEIENVFNE